MTLIQREEDFKKVKGHTLASLNTTKSCLENGLMGESGDKGHSPC
jgi:hypothetical protein